MWAARTFQLRGLGDLTAVARRGGPRLWAVIAAIVLAAACTIGSYLVPPRANPFQPHPNLYSWSAWSPGEIGATLFRPIERNAFLRLPMIDTSFSSVGFIDRRVGWATDGDGRIFDTEDGGRSWSQRRIEANRLRTQMRFADRDFGWAIGNRDVVYTTSDGGVTWSAHRTSTDYTLTAVHFIDHKIGWVVSDSGPILLTEDGGATWRTLSDQPGRSTSIKFLNRMKGWCLTAELSLLDGFRPKLLKTTDGGATWSSQDINASLRPRIEFYDLHFVDDEIGWLVGGDGTILKTIDGGNTWSVQTSGTTSALRSVHFVDDAVGWVVGGDGTVLATSDGGATWLPQSKGSPSYLRAVHFADRELGWAVAGGGVILASTDGGASWSIQRSGTDAHLYGVHFSNRSLGWAVGEYGTILRTSNGGQEWKAVGGQTQDSVMAVRFVDPNVGWAIVWSGAILGSTDGGLTWSQSGASGKDPAPTIPLTDLDLVDSEHGWIVGGEGPVLRLIKGGAWEPTRMFPPQDWLSSVDFVDERTGWIVGHGTILSTDDGGNTWKTAKHDLSIVGTFFLDRQVGWIVASGGEVAKTVDGGATWTLQASGAHRQLNDVQFLDPNTGWIVGDAATIIRTSDGGATWLPIEYRRYPGPWLYLSWLAIAGALFLGWGALGRLAGPDRRTIAEDLSPEEPIARTAEDRLNFAFIVAGLARFILNRDTKAPIAIAINGDWGSGKSSLMRMLTTELRAGGARTAWFNAWHHQEDSVLLVPLLQNISSGIVPGVLTLAGLRFRVRLLLRRAWSNKPLTIAALGVVAFIGAYLFSHEVHKALLDTARALANGLPSEIYGIPLTGLKDALLDKRWGVSASLVLLLAIMTLIFLLDAMRPFPDTPAILSLAVSEKFKLADARKQAAYREKFAARFRDVVLALRPSPVVLFVDDLDRCNKDTVMQALEAMNFLSCNAPCFIILGMARARVEDLIGLANADLAKETIDALDISEEETGLSQEEREKRRRRQYAREYLEKLIQIDVTVPMVASDRIPGIAVGRDKTPASWRAILSRSWQIAALTAVGVSVVWIAVLLGRYQQEAPPVATPQTVGATAPAAGTLATTGQPAAAPGTAAGAPQAPVAAAPAAAIQDGATGMAWWPAILVAVASLGGLALYLLMIRPPRNADSQAYKTAVEAWAKTIAARKPTPRSVKRFANMARFAAMMCVTKEERKRVFEPKRAIDRLKDDDSTDADEFDRAIVALTAMFHAREDLFRSASNPLLDADWKGSLVAMESREEKGCQAFAAALAKRSTLTPALLEEEGRLRNRLNALKSIGDMLQAESKRGAWPPHKGLVERFQYFVASNRFAGAPQPQAESPKVAAVSMAFSEKPAAQ